MNWFKPHEYDDSNNILQCKSVFTPFEVLQTSQPEPEPCMATMFEEKKRKNEIQYLPGEKLLMRLEKIRTKECRREVATRPTETPGPHSGRRGDRVKKSSNFEVDRLSDSLARVLRSVVGGKSSQL
jgi:hypothetical protein